MIADSLSKTQLQKQFPLWEHTVESLEVLQYRRSTVPEVKMAEEKATLIAKNLLVT